MTIFTTVHKIHAKCIAQDIPMKSAPSCWVREGISMYFDTSKDILLLVLL